MPSPSKFYFFGSSEQTKSEWNKFPGKLAGSAQPGYNAPKGKDLELLEQLKDGKEPVIDNQLISELEALYYNGVRTIYSLAHYPSDRHPELIKYLWENRYKDTKYVTEIKSVETSIEDFHSPTQAQLEAITSDAIERMKNGENVLVHCGYGSGRTGTVLAAIYMAAQNEFDVDKAIKYIRANYYSGAVEKEGQVNALKKFSLFLQKQAIAKINDKSSQEDKNKALVAAFSLNDNEQIRRLTSIGANFNQAIVNASNEGKANALIYAASNNISNIAIGNIIDVNVNAKDINGNSIFNLALQNGNINLAALLIGHPKLDVNLKDSVGRSPITLAIEEKNQSLIKAIILKGAKLEAVQRNDIPADLLNECYKEAIDNSNIKIFNNLVNFDSGLKNCLLNGSNATDYAFENDKKEMFIYFAMVDSRINSSEKEKNIEKAILMLENHPDIMEKFIFNGISLEPLVKGNSVLEQRYKQYCDLSNIQKHFDEAIENDNVEKAINLVKINPHLYVNINKLLYNNQSDFALVLLENGYKNYAYTSSNPIDNVVKFLLEQGRADQLQEYINNGANIANITKDGFYLKNAINSKNEKLVELIIKHGDISSINDVIGYKQTALIASIEADNQQIIDLVINAKGIDVNKANQEATPLMIAVEKMSIYAIKKLIEKGVNVNQIVDGNSAVLTAVGLHKAGMLEILIKDFKANPNLLYEDDRTALMLTDNPKIAKILLDNGADPEIVDAKGFSARDYHANNIEVLSLIKEALAKKHGDKYKDDEKKNLISAVKLGVSPTAIIGSYPESERYKIIEEAKNAISTLAQENQFDLALNILKVFPEEDKHHFIDLAKQFVPILVENGMDISELIETFPKEHRAEFVENAKEAIIRSVEKGELDIAFGILKAFPEKDRYNFIDLAKQFVPILVENGMDISEMIKTFSEKDRKEFIEISKETITQLAEKGKDVMFIIAAFPEEQRKEIIKVALNTYSNNGYEEQANNLCKNFNVSLEEYKTKEVPLKLPRLNFRNPVLNEYSKVIVGGLSNVRKVETPTMNLPKPKKSSRHAR